MGEFRGIVKKLAASIYRKRQENEKVSPHDISNMLDEALSGRPCHCYPSDEKTNDCYDTAFFISLRGSVARRGYPSFQQILDNFVEHMQGVCRTKTRNAVIVTDNWEPNAYEAKMHNIAAVRADGAIVEIYLIKPGNSNETEIEF